MITDEQVRLLRRKRMKNKTLEGAAAAAGMSARTAQKWQRGPLPSETKKARTWRTRKDPFEEIWAEVIVPLLKNDEKGKLQATTIFSELEERWPGGFSPGQLRTLQRRVRDWRAVHGPEREVFFEQVHPPGREVALDFTHATELGVVVAGVVLRHLLFVCRLSFSGWTWVQVAFGETFEALVSGLQGALWELGGVTEVARSDNLSAATHELKRTGGRALNERFKAVLEHYGLRSTRIRPGESHENGVAEKANHLVKSAIDQALILRGSRIFDSLDEYETFVRAVVAKSINRSIDRELAIEREHLRSLPAAPVPSYTTYRPTVRRWSTFRLGKRVYSVPSRLIGHEIEIRQHPDVLEVRYRDNHIETIPRLRGEDDVCIDYRHIIWSLVRKPGAFARYRYREELFPTMTFRRAYDALVGWRGDRADIEYVRILHLAACTMQGDVQRALDALLEIGDRFDYVAVQAVANPHTSDVPDVRIPEPDLHAYDRLLGGVR